MVNGENNGNECFFNSSSFDMCPISFSEWGLPSKNEHLNNFTCRYLSFLDTNVAKPIYFSNEAIGKNHPMKNIVLFYLNKKYSQPDRILLLFPNYYYSFTISKRWRYLGCCQYSWKFHRKFVYPTHRFKLYLRHEANGHGSIW